MSIHVAIVHKPYDEHILAGRKTVEARLTKTSVPPFGCIKPGDRIYFKRSSGPFFAVATAARVWMADRLEAADIDRIHKQFNDAIRGDRTIWSKWRRSAKYAVLVWLRDVTATIESPIYKTQNMRAWYVLDDAAKPRDRTGAFEVTLTGGAIRNHYVRVTEHRSRFPAASFGGNKQSQAGQPITLHLHGGLTVKTDLIGANQRSAMFRWRGWGSWFAKHRLRDGDRLQFTPVGRGVYNVRPVRAK